MPETQTQTSSFGESDIRLALGIGAAACCLNIGNTFSRCAVEPNLRTPYQNITTPYSNASLPALGKVEFGAIVISPSIFSAILLPIVGALLDRNHAGLIAALLSVIAAAGRALQMFAASMPATFVIGHILGSGATQALHSLQIYLLLFSYSPLYQAPLLGLLFATDFIACALAFAIHPLTFMWPTFGASVVSVVVSVILCHLLFLAKDPDAPERTPANPKDLPRLAWVVIVLAALPAVFLLRLESLMGTGPHVPGIFFAAAIVLTPLLGVGVSASKMTPPWTFLGAFLLLFGLLLSLVHKKVIHPLPECLIQIGQNAIVISLAPLLALICPQNGLGLAVGIMGATTSTFKMIASIPLGIFLSTTTAVSWVILGLSLTVIFVLTTVLGIIIFRNNALMKSSASENTSLLAMK